MCSVLTLGCVAQRRSPAFARVAMTHSRPCPCSHADPINVIEGITLDGLYQTLLGGNLDPKEVSGLAVAVCFFIVI